MTCPNEHYQKCKKGIINLAFHAEPGWGVDGWKGRGLMKMMFGNGTHMIMLHILLPSIFSFFSSFLGSIGKHVRTEGADG